VAAGSLFLAALPWGVASMTRLWIGCVALAAVLAQPARAADVDIPVQQRVIPVPVYSWTGCYLGAEGGWAWGRSRHETLSGPATPYYALSGGTIGGTLGCNYQVSQVLFGVEGDYSWMFKKGNNTENPGFDAATISETKENWLATARARVGIVPMQQWLFYVTGGYAVASVTARVLSPIAPAFDQSESKSRHGWTVGVGMEWAIAGAWTWKFEYLYVNLQDLGYFALPPAGVIPRTAVTTNDHIARVGLNYRFGGGLVSASY
jgi:outer membrane immunogenic protein